MHMDRPRISKRSKNSSPDALRSAASWRTTNTRSTQTLCSLQTINLLPIFLVCSKRHTNGSSRINPRACGSFYFTKSIDSQIFHCLDTLDTFYGEKSMQIPWLREQTSCVIIIRPEYHFRYLLVTMKPTQTPLFRSNWCRRLSGTNRYAVSSK